MFFRKCQNPNTSRDRVWVTRVFSSRKSKSGRSHLFAEPDAPMTPDRFRPWGWSSREIGFVSQKTVRSQRFSFAGFRRRTPGPPPFSPRTRLRRAPSPPPFSSINSTPAFSRARRMADALANVIVVFPSVDSARWIVAGLTPDSRTRSAADQRRRARAALI